MEIILVAAICAVAFIVVGISFAIMFYFIQIKKNSPQYSCKHDWENPWVSEGDFGSNILYKCSICGKFKKIRL